MLWNKYVLWYDDFIYSTMVWWILVHIAIHGYKIIYVKQHHLYEPKFILYLVINYKEIVWIDVSFPHC